jgi:hypothetical protein
MKQNCMSDANNTILDIALKNAVKKTAGRKSIRPEAFLNINGNTVICVNVARWLKFHLFYKQINKSAKIMFILIQCFNPYQNHQG